MTVVELFFACAGITFLAALFAGVFEKGNRSSGPLQVLAGFIWVPGLIATVILGVGLLLRVMTRM
jgi:hypothetical protein